MNSILLTIVYIFLIYMYILYIIISTNYIGIVIYLANLSQYISKAISETTSNCDLKQLPFMNDNIILGLTKNKIYTLKDLLQYNNSNNNNQSPAADQKSLERLLTNCIQKDQHSPLVIH